MLLIIWQVYRRQFIEIIEKTLSDSAAMRQLCITGHIFGKKSHFPGKHETRAILPLGAMLSLFDALINVLLAPIVNDLTPKDSRIFFGAPPKTQPLQLMHTCHLVIEKGMDRKSQACIAQGDIKKFYDRLRCTMIAEFLCMKGVDPGLIGAILRFHTCPQLFLVADSARFEIIGRSRGVLTGARSAVTLGRIPVEDSFSKCLESWGDFGFDLGSHKLCAVAWVDNIFNFGPSSLQATSIIDKLERELRVNWELELADDSKIFMVCKGNPDADLVLPGWTSTTCFRGLGHIISNDGATEDCWRNARDAMWGSFWANSAAVLNSKDVGSKLRLLNRVTRPKLDYVCSRWPFTRKRADALDHTQRRMTGLCLNLKRSSDQSAESYFSQRDQLVGSPVRKEGRWSHRWCNLLLTWQDHILRDRNKDDLPGPIYRVQDSLWLQAQRLPFVSATRSLLAGGTGTRLLAEAPKARWEESTDRALDFVQR